MAIGADITEERQIIRVEGRTAFSYRHSLVREEPLEIRVNGVPLATLMRTPGLEMQLVTGFCFTEGLISAFSDIQLMEYCSTPDGEEAQNIINVRLKNPKPPEWAQRALAVRSACGICGRVMIEDLAQQIVPITSSARLDPQILAGLGEQMRKNQPVFSVSGATHAAALFTLAGELVFCAEDLGRHNALDKVIGYCLMAGIEMRDKVATLSGRASYEMVIKAGRAGIPIATAVSAPTLLAVELSRKIQLTLIGFMRGSNFNIYSREDRICLSE